jgi:hypothetical protein
MFLIVSSFVFHGPETCPYSQDLMVKKNAPMNSSHNALSKGGRVQFYGTFGGWNQSWLPQGWMVHLWQSILIAIIVERMQVFGLHPALGLLGQPARSLCHAIQAGSNRFGFDGCTGLLIPFLPSLIE